MTFTLEERQVPRLFVHFEKGPVVPLSIVQEVLSGLQGTSYGFEHIVIYHRELEKYLCDQGIADKTIRGSCVVADESKRKHLENALEDAQIKNLKTKKEQTS